MTALTSLPPNPTDNDPRELRLAGTPYASGTKLSCPKCGSDHSTVSDSRGRHDAIRRRRNCHQCGFRYTTYETVRVRVPVRQEVATLVAELEAVLAVAKHLLATMETDRDMTGPLSREPRSSED